jgi:hypothetical protein
VRFGSRSAVARSLSSSLRRVAPPPVPAGPFSVAWTVPPRARRWRRDDFLARRELINNRMTASGTSGSRRQFADPPTLPQGGAPPEGPRTGCIRRHAALEPGARSKPERRVELVSADDRKARATRGTFPKMSLHGNVRRSDRPDVVDLCPIGGPLPVIVNGNVPPMTVATPTGTSPSGY